MIATTGTFLPLGFCLLSISKAHALKIKYNFSNPFIQIMKQTLIFFFKTNMPQKYTNKLETHEIETNISWNIIKNLSWLSVREGVRLFTDKSNVPDTPRLIN